MNPTVVPLLPKLRGHFAEFLQQSSLKRLRILSSTTCVGLRYGHKCISLAAFLGSVGSGLFVRYLGLMETGLPWLPPLKPFTEHSIALCPYLPASLHRTNEISMVLEY